MLKIKLIFIQLILMSCVGRDLNVRIPYNIHEVKIIEENFFLIKRIIDKLVEESDISIVNAGYFISNNKLYFNHCLDISTGYYADVDRCNYSKYLSNDDEKNLVTAINALERVNIIGFFYSEAEEAFFLNLEVDYSSFENSRYLYVSKERPAINTTLHEILDQESYVYYVKNKTGS